MIIYNPFFETLKEKNLTTYRLMKDYGISSSTINRLRHNKPVSTNTLSDICSMLDCSIEDVVAFKKDTD